MPEVSLNSKLTLPCAPLAKATGQVTVVPGFTATLDGQLTCASSTPACARSCSSCLSTVEPGRTTLPGLNA